MPKKIKIPVKIENGRITYLGEDILLKLNNNIKAELHVSENAIKDFDLRSKFLDSEIIPVLKPPQILLVEMQNKSVSDKIQDYFYQVRSKYKIHNRFLAEVELLSPLYIEFFKHKKSTFRPCKLNIPFINKEALSLNHAYTLLSEEIETYRRSHTSNVFERVYFHKDNSWYPLQVLREEFEQKLNWWFKDEQK